MVWAVHRLHALTDNLLSSPGQLCIRQPSLPQSCFLLRLSRLRDEKGHWGPERQSYQYLASLPSILRRGDCPSSEEQLWHGPKRAEDSECWLKFSSLLCSQHCDLEQVIQPPTFNIFPPGRKAWRREGWGLPKSPRRRWYPTMLCNSLWNSAPGSEFSILPVLVTRVSSPNSTAVTRRCGDSHWRASAGLPQLYADLETKPGCKFF